MDKYRKITKRIRRFISPVSFFFMLTWSFSCLGGALLLLLNAMMYSKGGPPLLVEESAWAFVIGLILSPLVESDKDLTPEQKAGIKYRQELLRELENE